MKAIRFFALLAVFVLALTGCDDVTGNNSAEDITWTLEQYGGSPTEGGNPAVSSTGIIIRFSDTLLFLDNHEITVSGAAIQDTTQSPTFSGYDWRVPIITTASGNSGIATVSINKTGVESGPKNVTVYKDMTILVIFDKNNTDSGGTEASPRIMSVLPPEETIGSLPAQPTRPGYIFTGWKDASGSDFSITTPVTETMTVYAQWNVNQGDELAVLFAEVIDKLHIANPVFGNVYAHDGQQPLLVVPIRGSVINHKFSPLDINTDKLVPVSPSANPDYVGKVVPDVETLRTQVAGGGPTRPGALMPEIRYIIYHDTQNCGRVYRGDASSHADLLLGGQTTSWHYTVDSMYIFQHIPSNEIAWHAGSYPGNLYSIGIETCVNYGVIKNDFYLTWQSMGKLVASLLDEYNLTLDAVKSHNEISAIGMAQGWGNTYIKCCPATLRHAVLWEMAKDMIKYELLYLQKIENEGFTAELIINPADAEYIDAQGRVIKLPPAQRTVSYTVRLTAPDNTVREKTYSSVLPAQGTNYIGKCDMTSPNCEYNAYTTIPSALKFFRRLF
jgi:uncharacterized repeat protein (TIGR02543 family)